MWDWLSVIANGADQIGADVWAFLVWLLDALVSVFVFLYKLLVAVFNFLYTIAVKVVSFFKHLWTGFFKTIFTDFFKAIRAAHTWLEKHLGPTIQFLKRMRDLWDRYYRMYVRPFLNLMQRMRRILFIFRALHFKFASTLDGWIGKIEGRVAGAFLAIRSIFTLGIDVLNALADPMNLIRRPTLVLSMRRLIPTLCKVTTGLPLGFFLPSTRAGVQTGLGPLPFNFNPADPTMNPPASSYFAADDGLAAFQGFAPGDLPSDGAVDDVMLLDYFDQGLYPPPECQDPAYCAQQWLLAQPGWTSISVGT